MLWKQARRYGQQSAIDKVHHEMRSLEERRARLCEGILNQQWHSVSELQTVLQTLEPTIIDQQAARWRLDVLKSAKEPDELPQLPKNKNKKPRLLQPTQDAEESDETLTSESESGQAGLGVEEQRSRQNVHRVHYQEPIVILDDEPEVNNKGLAMSGPIGFQVESSRSTGNRAARRGPVTGFSTGKEDNGTLVSNLNLGPNTDTCQDNGLNSMKRKDPGDQDQSRAKRPKPIEVIELSDEDDNEVSTRELEPVPNISGDNGSHELHVEFGGQHANRHITEDDWARVCKMFQCPASTTNLRPPGFGIEIAAYQLHAIWWMLTQQPVRGIQGGCLGDAMGLGKTIEVLSTFATFAMIKANHEEVLSFWKDGVVTEGRQHLPRKQTESHERCPSQSESPYPTECTCIKSGDTYKIATRMPSLPTICVVPPTAMRFWAAEFCKILDMTHKVATHLRLSMRHNDYTKDQQLYHGQDRVQLTAGAAVRQLDDDDDDGEGQLLVGGRPTLSNWLVLVSRHSATKLYAMYDNMSSRASDENGDIVMNLMGASFVFFDEAHQYNGTLDSPTGPFRFLCSLRETSLNEPVAFTISASIPLSGPIQMANIVNHVLHSRYLQGQEERIGGVDDAQALKVAQTNYEYLIDNLNRLTDEKTKKAIKSRQETLHKLEKELVPCLLMARRPTDTFRGQPIGEGSRDITVEHINCPMGDGLARDAFQRMTADVQSYVQRLLLETKQEWEQGGRIGPEPTKQSVEAGLFSRGEDNNVAARINHESKKSWIRLIRAGVYPFLAHLLDRDVIKDKDLDHKPVNQLGVTACKAYFTKGWDEMVSTFEKSSLWSHRKELSQQSPRFDRLCQFVDEMLSYRSQAPTADDPGPRDGTNIRHMIVLTQSPSSAFITYMLLAHAYKGNVTVVLFNAATKNDASASDNGYGRN
ncbi:hypothetical protein NPX13_g11064 [Xylaria arbuscula]|uniref:Helicase ATP-binding domain-containing protein n=1 Tax=Xylaria arbuscula TaxID=114810 RepID=A0A9W8N3J6_9PEZI|nr:hypothetical protein NPX13_g11064 [Xylaria arbuscula]